MFSCNFLKLLPAFSQIHFGVVCELRKRLQGHIAIKGGSLLWWPGGALGVPETVATSSQSLSSFRATATPFSSDSMFSGPRGPFWGPLRPHGLTGLICDTR